MWSNACTNILLSVVLAETLTLYLGSCRLGDFTKSPVVRFLHDDQQEYINRNRVNNISSWLDFTKNKCQEYLQTLFSTHCFLLPL